MAFLFLLLSAAFAKFDCNQAQPFPTIETQQANVYVGRFYWTTTTTGKEERVEDVCTTTQPLALPVLDIRGREEEWYDCWKGIAELQCKTRFQNKTATLYVRPAIVLRTWGPGKAVRDSHFHAYVVPDNKPAKFLDFFARSNSYDLTKRELTIDTAGGGRGQESGIDSFYVRVDFLKE